MAKALGRLTMTTTNNNKKATTKRFRWNADGRDGPNDPNTSEQVLIQWLSTSNHYKTYRESTSRGAKKCYKKKATRLTKLQLCQQASDRIQRAGVRCPRTAQQVKDKIERLERQFREAQRYIVQSEEGQRRHAKDPRFFPCWIRRKCPRYASLRQFMSDSIVSGDADDKKPVPDDLLGRMIEVPAGGASALDQDGVDVNGESGEDASGDDESDDESNEGDGDGDESGDDEDESGSDDDGPDEESRHRNDGASRLLWLEMMYYLYREEEDDQDDYDEMSDMSSYFVLRRLQREQNLRTALARFKATTRQHRPHHHGRRRR